jgi:hypothetical protein
VSPEDLQAGLDQLNESSPPVYDPNPLLAIYRHPCSEARVARRTGRPVSTAIDLKEIYVTRWVDGRPESDPNDEFALLFRQGICKHCMQPARSRKGRLVLVADRPPVLGRVGRQ